MTEAPYYTVRRTLQGAWAVVHEVPGTGTLVVDVECPSVDAAEREAAWMNAERERDTASHAHERALCGVRP